MSVTQTMPETNKVQGTKVKKMLFKKKRAATAEGETTKAKARLVVCANWVVQLFTSLFAPR